MGVRSKTPPSGVSFVAAGFCLLVALCHLQQGQAAQASSSSSFSSVKKWISSHLPTWNDASSTGLGQDSPEEDPQTDFEDGDDNTVRAHWALLIAGSAGWGNYRHQSDVSHAYHVLRRGGFEERHVIVMVYDDIAHNVENPAPGKIFNSPGGPDVYDGLKVDYSGQDVNAKNFLSVLGGDKAAVKGVGSGRVIASGPNDRVFVFYSDHGAPGLLGMPTGDFLYADQLMATLKKMYKARRYREAVLYIEACESGSMFEGLLDEGLNIYATTAANAEESSWGTYCPGMDPAPGDEFNTCLGDLYSVAWMENSEVADLTQETLQVQYMLVRTRTSNNYTYMMGSHVMQYGDMDIQREKAGDYMGMCNSGPEVDPECPAPSPSSAYSSHLNQGHPRKPLPHHAVPQRDADLEPLRHKYAHAKTPEAKAAAKAALDAALGARRRVDDAARAAASRLFLLPHVSHKLMSALSLQPRTVFAAQAGSASNKLTPDPAVVNQLLHGTMGRPSKGVPLVDDWDCLRAMVAQWGASCGRPMDQYSMKHSRLLANLCNAGLGPQDLKAALHGSGCEEAGAEAIHASVPIS